jgi:hypothetical protein
MAALLWRVFFSPTAMVIAGFVAIGLAYFVDRWQPIASLRARPSTSGI